MKNRSFFWPLTFIATGVIWLLISLNVIPEQNLWALTHIWPFVLIALGLGMIVRSYLPVAGWVISALIVASAVAAIVFAPQLGWAAGPNWNFADHFNDFGDLGDIGGDVNGSGNIKTETRKVSDFVAIDLNYPAEVVVTQGETESVTIKADDNLLPQLATEVNGNVLTIRNKEESRSKRVDPTELPKITIVVKDLSKIEFSTAGSLVVKDLKIDALEFNFSGAGEMSFEGLEAESFRCELTGAGSVVIEDINVKSMDCQLSGAGSISANGVATSLSLEMNGAGSFNGKDLSTDIADIQLNSIGSAEISVKEELKAEVNGLGSVTYYGSPKVDQSVNGMGSITQGGK